MTVSPRPLGDIDRRKRARRSVTVHAQHRSEDIGRISQHRGKCVTGANAALVIVDHHCRITTFTVAGHVFEQALSHVCRHARSRIGCRPVDGRVESIHVGGGQLDVALVRATVAQLVDVLGRGLDPSYVAWLRGRAENRRAATRRCAQGTLEVTLSLGECCPRRGHVHDTENGDIAVVGRREDLCNDFTARQRGQLRLIETNGLREERVERARPRLCGDWNSE